jgi:hypothetical protein
LTYNWNKSQELVITVWYGVVKDGFKTEEGGAEDEGVAEGWADDISMEEETKEDGVEEDKGFVNDSGDVRGREVGTGCTGPESSKHMKNMASNQN